MGVGAVCTAKALGPSGLPQTGRDRHHTCVVGVVVGDVNVLRQAAHNPQGC